MPRLGTILFSILFSSLVFGADSEEDCSDPSLHAIEGHIPCGTDTHPQTRRLFACPDRLVVLTELGIEREGLAQELDAVTEEHLLVKTALQRSVHTPGLTPFQRAVLWEEMTAQIQRRVGQPVSIGFRGYHQGHEIYIFQGFRRFDGQVYVLAFLADGRALTGKVDPIDDVGAWRGRLSELKEITAPPPAP